MVLKIFKTFLFISLFFVFWSLYIMIKGYESGNFDINSYFGVAIGVSIVIIAIIFRPSKKKAPLSDIDPLLIPIIKDILRNYLSSREKGELVNNKNISPQLIPAMQEDLSAYKGFLSNGVTTESRVKDIENLNYTVQNITEKSVKVKISGLFRHDYFSSGRLIANPGDPTSYLHDAPESSFNSSSYIFNFEKIAQHKYQLIGYTDDIMGNKYGRL